MTERPQDILASLAEPENKKLGRVLVLQGLLTPEQYTEAESLTQKWGVPLVDVLMARRWISQPDLFKAVASFHDVDYFDFAQSPPSCLLYTSPSPRDLSTSRMPSSA